MYKTDATESTRGPCASDVDKKWETGAVDKVCYVPFLVDQMIAYAVSLLRSVNINLEEEDGAIFAAKVHPSLTTQFLTPRIYAEGDSQAWIFQTYAYPAIALAWAIK